VQDALVPHAWRAQAGDGPRVHEATV
jgi:hypothetical protein